MSVLFDEQLELPRAPLGRLPAGSKWIRIKSVLYFTVHIVQHSD
jgi:hypothetical protein